MSIGGVIGGYTSDWYCMSNRIPPITGGLATHTSGMGPEIDMCEQRLEPDELNDASPAGVNGVKSVNNMSLFARNELMWPVRCPIN